MVFLSKASICQPLQKTSIYLNDALVSKNAKNFYQRKFKASDDERTESIIDSLKTSNSKTRPFYIFLVSKMLTKADGALAELLGLECKEFAEQNPDALISFLYSKNIDSAYFEDWTGAIAGEFQIECEGSEYHCVDSSFKIAANNCLPDNMKKLSSFYKLIRRSILERRIIDKVLALPEVQKEIRYVETASKGKRHLGATISERPSEEFAYYLIKVWEDNGVSYVSHFNFFVNPKTLTIKYQDTVHDTLLDLKTWRQQRKRSKN
jgi:hypothetical protein